MRSFRNLDLSCPRLLDGGFATELERRGLAIKGPLWSSMALLNAPEAVLAVHRSYLEAGADILLTGTYQASSLGFQALGFTLFEAEQRAERTLRAGVELALQARSEHGRPDVLVGVSRVPYGGALANGAEFTGAYGFVSPEEEFTGLAAFHAARIGAVAGTGADFLAFETVPKLAEARAIATALDSWPELGAWVSFTCRDGSSTAYGDPVRECAAFLNGVKQVCAVGVNCIPPGLVLPLLGALRTETGRPLVVYPNSGEVWDAEARCWIPGAPLSWDSFARDWLAAGASVVGGCCRTGPEEVRALRQAAQRV